MENTSNAVTNPVNQTTKHESTSARYNFLSTSAIKTFIESEGYFCKRERVQYVRKPERRGFQKHALEFVRESDKAWFSACGTVDEAHRIQFGGGGEKPIVPVVYITNSHDGRSGVVLRGGFHRIECNNGLVVSTGNDTIIRITHTKKNIEEEVKHAVYRIVAMLERKLVTVKAMQSTKLDFMQLLDFATRAIELLPHAADRGFDQADLLITRRGADVGNDVWHAFNVIQENIVKGGLKPTNGRRTRAISSVDRDFYVNESLWTMAESYLQAA